MNNVENNLNRTKTSIILSTLNSSTSKKNKKNDKKYRGDSFINKNLKRIKLENNSHNSNQNISLKKYQVKNNCLNKANGNKSISTKDSSFSSTKKSSNNNFINTNFEYSKKNYCNYIPTREETSKKACLMPCYFPIYTFHGINTNHNIIGKSQLLNLEGTSYFNKNSDSYKSIERKDHILINHLCQKIIDKKIINSFTIKYRHKNTTFLYFK